MHAGSRDRMELVSFTVGSYVTLADVWTVVLDTHLGISRDQ